MSPLILALGKPLIAVLAFAGFSLAYRVGDIGAARPGMIGGAAGAGIAIDEAFGEALVVPADRVEIEIEPEIEPLEDEELPADDDAPEPEE